MHTYLHSVRAIENWIHLPKRTPDQNFASEVKEVGIVPPKYSERVSLHRACTNKAGVSTTASSQHHPTHPAPAPIDWDYSGS